MTNSKRIKLILAGMLCGWLLASVAEAAETPILSMLPPTNFADQPCKDTTAGILQWDGQSYFKCIPGLVGDKNGNLTTNGTITLAKGAEVGAGCAPEGAIAYDGRSTKHQLVYCSEAHVWSASSVAVSCPAGQALKGIANGAPVCSGLQIEVRTENLPFASAPQYVDCPADTVAIACNSVAIPSGSFSCPTTPGATDPATGMSACLQSGCTNHGTDDTTYYTTATCMQF